MTCIENGYQAVYAADAIAYELQLISFSAQYRQKIRRADGLVNSTRLFQSTYNEKRKWFWKQVFPHPPVDAAVLTAVVCDLRSTPLRGSLYLVDGIWFGSSAAFYSAVIIS